MCMMYVEKSSSYTFILSFKVCHQYLDIFSSCSSEYGYLPWKLKYIDLPSKTRNLKKAAGTMCQDSGPTPLRAHMSLLPWVLYT